MPILQTVKRHYLRATDYQTFQLANRSTCYDDTEPNFDTKIVRKVELQVKAHFIDPSNPISTIRFLATSKLACDTNGIYERADTWVLAFFFKNALA